MYTHVNCEGFEDESPTQCQKIDTVLELFSMYSCRRHGKGGNMVELLEILMKAG